MRQWHKNLWWIVASSIGRCVRVVSIVIFISKVYVARQNSCLASEMLICFQERTWSEFQHSRNILEDTSNHQFLPFVMREIKTQLNNKNRDLVHHNVLLFATWCGFNVFLTESCTSLLKKISFTNCTNSSNFSIESLLCFLWYTFIASRVWGVFPKNIMSHHLT